VVISCVRKVAVHFGYGLLIWLSGSKLPLKCAVFSLYSVVQQRFKCNTMQICRKCLGIKLNGFRPVWTLVDLTSNTFCKCTATFRTHYIISSYYKFIQFFLTFGALLGLRVPPILTTYLFYVRFTLNFPETALTLWYV
jgi:hypothetical protein